MNSRASYPLIIILVSMYMLLAIVWWTILLLQQNELLFELSTDLQRASGIMVEFDEGKFKRQKQMIIGEGLVFGLALLSGMYLLYRSYRRELKVQTNKSNFLMSITHELKTPVTAIKLFLQTIRKTNDQGDSLNKINDAAMTEVDRLQKMIDKLLTANQLEAGFDYQLENINLKESLNERIEQFSWRHPDYQILNQITEDVFISFDHTALVSILDNLIENAHKYRGSSTNCTIRHEAKGSFHEIQFVDQGIGIPAADRAEIFQKFFRSEDENTRRTKGTGLGLFISQRFMEDLNGKISYRPNSPKGSIFTLRFKK